MSQDDFAHAIRQAGQRVGRPNGATKRLIQRWESGTVAAPRPEYARALETVTGMPIASLGFVGMVPTTRVGDDGQGGHDVAPSAEGVAAPVAAASTQLDPRANYSGVWLSRYEFYSSGRDTTYICQHHVVVLQHGNRLTVRSLPSASTNPDSPLTMDLTVDGSVVTGTWVEQTATDGYYRGARYHGALQLLVEPTGRRMAGKWVGFGKDMDINTGPWELVFRDASTTQATLAKYNRPPE